MIEIKSRIEGQSKKAKLKTQRNDCITMQWATRSDIRRADDGLQNASYRIKCLGNAVVPQVAEVFTKAIREYEEKVI